MEAYRHRVRSEQKEGKIFGGDEREKYANISNPSNSETSKKKATETYRQSLIQKEALQVKFCTKILGKYFSWCSSSPSLFVRKTQTRMRFNTIFELKVLGRESSTRIKCIIIKYKAPFFLPPRSLNSTASTPSLCTLLLFFFLSPSTPHHKEYIKKTLFLTEKNPTIMIWWCGALPIIL